MVEIIVVTDVAALKALPVANLTDGQIVNVKAFAPGASTGGGLFEFMSSGAFVEDGGVVIAAAAGGWFGRVRSGSRVEAAWFGARGDGVANDQPAIQAAIDFALLNGLAEVSLDVGTFATHDTIHLGYGEDYRSVSLVGNGPAFRGASNFAGTTIKPTFGDRPAIAIQGARYSAVKNLSLLGRNFDHIVTNRFERSGGPPLATRGDDLIATTTWVDPLLPPEADSVHAPYAGIAVDPYAGAPPADRYPDIAYPAWTKVAGQYGRPYVSSGVLIENVHINGFVVGIVSQPCDHDGNGDFLKIHRCRFEALKYGVSIGNGNSRNVSIRDCDYLYVYTFLTNSRHGRQIGQFGGPIDNISGGASYQFADIVSLAYSGPLVFRNVYFESQIRFGRLGNISSFNAPVIFEGCSFGPAVDFFGLNPSSFIEAPPQATLKFVGCMFGTYGRFMALTTDLCQTTFDACTFRSSAPEIEALPDGHYTAGEQAAHNYLCGGVFSPASPQIIGAINSMIYDATGALAPHLFTSVLRGARSAGHQGTEMLSYPGIDGSGNLVGIGARKPIMWIDKANQAVIKNLRFEGEQIEFDNAQQNVVYEHTFEIGDLIFDYPTGTLFVVEDLANASIYARIITNYALLNGVRTPLAPISSIVDPIGAVVMYPTRPTKTDYEYRGTTTAGSKAITNVRRPDGTAGEVSKNFLPGDLVSFTTPWIWDRIEPFATPTKITGVNVDPITNTAVITVDKQAQQGVADAWITLGITRS